MGAGATTNKFEPEFYYNSIPQAIDDGGYTQEQCDDYLSKVANSAWFTTDIHPPAVDSEKVGAL